MRADTTHYKTYKTPPRPQFRVNQNVEIVGKSGVIYRIAAGYRLETWDIYSLVELPDFFIKAERLVPVEHPAS